jgi:hypothetical protein
MGGGFERVPGKSNALDDARKASAAPVTGKRTLVEGEGEGVAPEPTAVHPVEQLAHGPDAAAPVQRKVDAGFGDIVEAAGVQRTAAHGSFGSPSHDGVRPVQAKEGPAGLDPERVHQAAQHGTSGSGGPLPHLDQIQRLFGRHDVSGVAAHTDARAAEGTRAMGAEAFANGEQVAFGGTPSLHTAAHEAAHVVQQRGGVQLKGGVGEAGDPYEQHANAVADLVVQGKSVESLLDRYGGAGGARGGAIQRLDSSFGKFDTTKYDPIGPAGNEWGVDMAITFDPDVKKVDATQIGLTQSVRSKLAGTPVAAFPSIHERMVPGDGNQIDRAGSGPFGNPLYAANSPTGKEKNLGETPTVAGWGQHGWAYKDKAGKQQHEIAKLFDTPSLPGRAKNASQEFETVALAVDGNQAGTYMGSVSWGWSTDGAGKFSKMPFKLVSKGDPSKAFNEAAKQWNSVANMGNVKTKANPTNVYDGTLSVAFTVAKGTDLTIVDGFYIVADETYDKMTVASGKEAGKTGYIKVNDMKDVGGANPVLKLPTR